VRTAYPRLYERFGPQRWWPAENPFEVMVGAVLTQNTNWRNVEQAIINLKKARLMNPEKMYLNRRRLPALIKPSGFYRQKVKKLTAFLKYFLANYRGDLRQLKRRPTGVIRKELLNVWGIGPETADSMLLYALDRPVFVIDAYTRRILSRHRIANAAMTYNNMQVLFSRRLKPVSRIYNEYHALLVRVGKTYCKKHDPVCTECPLKYL
jgi:endonuclease-3 related protein